MGWLSVIRDTESLRPGGALMGSVTTEKHMEHVLVQWPLHFKIARVLACTITMLGWERREGHPCLLSHASRRHAPHRIRITTLQDLN